MINDIKSIKYRGGEFIIAHSIDRFHLVINNSKKNQDWHILHIKQDGLWQVGSLPGDFFDLYRGKLIISDKCDIEGLETNTKRDEFITGYGRYD